MYTLSADFGTSSVKTAIVDENKKLIQTSKRTYQYQISEQEHIELDMKTVEEAFYGTVMDLREYLPEVRLISFDTFAPSLVLMDEKGNALHPIVTHLDRRSRQYTKLIMESFGKNAYRQITGTLPYAGGVTLTTLLWFKENQPELFGRIFKIGHLSTYLFRKLTGVWAIDEVNASITGIYETVTGNGWSKSICSTFGISEDILPEVCEADITFAPILPEIAIRLGVGADTIVNLGTQDVASAIAGAGLHKSGQVLCISGSSEMVAVLTDKPITSDKYYLRRTGMKGLWQVFSITTGGFAIDWFRQQFCPDIEEEVFYESYLPQLLEHRFDDGGVTFHPYLTGDRQSLRKKKGSFSGLALGTNREHMLCALVKGIQKQSKETVDTCRHMIQVENKIYATGNLVDSYSYAKIKSKIFGNTKIHVKNNCPLLGNVKCIVPGKESEVC